MNPQSFIYNLDYICFDFNHFDFIIFMLIFLLPANVLKAKCGKWLICYKHFGKRHNTHWHTSHHITHKHTNSFMSMSKEVWCVRIFVLFGLCIIRIFFHATFKLTKNPFTHITHLLLLKTYGWMNEWNEWEKRWLVSKK